MPQDRLRSPRGSHGRRLCALTDFEFRVWDQYQLSSDDFGVMRCSPLTIQADNDNLAERPVVEVQEALERLIAVGLVLAFEHQGRRYLCQNDWQTFQKIEYPRRTNLPKPPDGVLETCDKPTRQLFAKYPGGFRKKRGKRAEGVPSTSRAHPENVSKASLECDDGEPTTCLKPLAVSVSRLPLAAVIASPPKEPADPRIREFILWFVDEFKSKRHGADYLVNWAKDSATVKALLKATELSRLQNLARILLSDKTDDSFIVNTDRGIGILSVKFNWLSDKLAAFEAKHKAGVA